MTTNRDAMLRKLMLAFIWFCSALSVVALASIVYLRCTGQWHNF